jgi:nucleotide-binding universal stress UspA family protein
MSAYENVVVEVDDSPAGARVVELAALHAAETGSKLLLVTAYRSSGSGSAGPALKRAAETCATMGAGVVETVTVAGDPATVLAEVARDHGADLLMVGNHGLSTLGGRLVGSVPGKVIGKASCDVLVAHTTTHGWLKPISRHHRPSSYQRTILVGVHDTAHSMRAAEKAGALAADLDAELILVGAYERPEKPHQGGWRRLMAPTYDLGFEMDALGPAESHLLARSGLSDIESALRDGAARARKQGAEKVETVAVPGDPVHGLLKIADERRADIVVVGNHPQAQGSARLIGSISSQVSRKTSTHVLLVH